MAKTAVNKAGRNKILGTLVILASIAMAIAVADIAISVFMAGHDDEFRSYISAQAVYSQSIVADTNKAMNGDQQAFTDLLQARNQFDTSLNRILNGHSSTLMPAAQGDAFDKAQQINQSWTNVRKAIGTVLDNSDKILLADGLRSDINANLPGILTQWDKIANSMAKSGGIFKNQLYFAEHQSFLGQRLQNEANDLVGGNGNLVAASNQLASDLERFTNIGQGLAIGDVQLGIKQVRVNDIQSQIQQLNGQSATAIGNLGTLTSLSTALIDSNKAARTISAASADLLGSIQALGRAYAQQVDARIFQPTYGYIIGGIALIILLITLYVYLLSGDARKAEAIRERQTERNQDAILRLLDELGSLADGDLTVEVSVTEDITGAIADSINFALEALRDLVRTINDTAVQVDGAARETSTTATELAEVTQRQTTQITSASERISEMARSIEQVSDNAERSTRVASQSVEIAHNGGEAVRRTIEGMNAIRETIQDTSKRIKRLGESSQEIGDIVELINDIAEQTNILALNAAIQASMAGEAGRGFAVVADEVQRLAERSANATRQIETLVKTIQTDTNEAVTSMEQSTSGVVNTAALAENAGSALDEIEKVSNNMSTLIENISRTATQQSEAASGVADSMEQIQETTTRTSSGTTAAAASIGKLAELATQLRTSVSGFKLPGQQPEEEALAVEDDESFAQENPDIQGETDIESEEQMQDEHEEDDLQEQEQQEDDVYLAEKRAS